MIGHLKEENPFLLDHSFLKSIIDSKIRIIARRIDHAATDRIPTNYRRKCQAMSRDDPRPLHLVVSAAAAWSRCWLWRVTSCWPRSWQTTCRGCVRGRLPPSGPHAARAGRGVVRTVVSSCRRTVFGPSRAMMWWMDPGRRNTRRRWRSGCCRRGIGRNRRPGARAAGGRATSTIPRFGCYDGTRPDASSSRRWLRVAAAGASLKRPGPRDGGGRCAVANGILAAVLLAAGERSAGANAWAWLGASSPSRARRSPVVLMIAMRQTPTSLLARLALVAGDQAGCWHWACRDCCSGGGSSRSSSRRRSPPRRPPVLH